MSSEKHLEGDTRELSESEALLGYARSTTVLPELRSPTLDKLAGHCPEDLSVITNRLKELADQKGAYKLKYREMINKRQIHDAAIDWTSPRYVASLNLCQTALHSMPTLHSGTCM